MVHSSKDTLRDVFEGTIYMWEEYRENIRYGYSYHCRARRNGYQKRIGGRGQERGGRGRGEKGGRKRKRGRRSGGRDKGRGGRESCWVAAMTYGEGTQPGSRDPTGMKLGRKMCTGLCLISPCPLLLAPLIGRTPQEAGR